MNKQITTLGIALASALFSAGAQADPARISGVGSHIAHQGNQALLLVQGEAERSVQQAATEGLDGNLDRIQVAQGREAAVGGGGPVAPKDVTGSRYTIHSTCP